MPDYYYENVPYHPGYRVLVDRSINGNTSYVQDVNGRHWYKENPDDEEYTRLAKRIADLNMLYWNDPNDILYVVNLPEVTIKPEDWQTELINAFKDVPIFDDLAHTKDYIYNEPDDFMGTLYDREKRFYNMWALAGKPRIKNAHNFPDMYFKLSSLFGTNMGTKEYPRAHGTVYPFHLPSTLYITNSRNAISEISHPILRDFGKNYKFLNWFDNIRYSDDNSDNGLYGNPKSREYETHSVIEPQVSDYIFYNIIPDFLKNNK